MPPQAPVDIEDTLYVVVEGDNEYAIAICASTSHQSWRQMLDQLLRKSFARYVCRATDATARFSMMRARQLCLRALRIDRGQKYDYYCR